MEFRTSYMILFQILTDPTICFSECCCSFQMDEMGSITNWEFTHSRQVRGGQKFSPTIFHSWHLFKPENEFRILPRSCRIMQEYVADQIRKAKAEELPNLREHQKQLHGSESSSRPELLDNFRKMKDEASVVRADGMFTLPSTYVSWERYMPQ